MKPDWVLSRLPEHALDLEDERILVRLGRRKTVPKEVREAHRERIVVSSLREAVNYLRRCSRCRLPDADLLSVAYKALKRAIKSFRVGRGTRFFTFSKPFLRGDLSEHWKTFNVVHLAHRHSSLDLIPTHFQCDLATLTVPDEDGDISISAGTETVSSFDQAGVEKADLMREVLKLLPTLTPKEQIVISLHYQQDMSMTEVARVTGVSRSAVSALIQKATHKLRCRLSQNTRLLKDGIRMGKKLFGARSGDQDRSGA